MVLTSEMRKTEEPRENWEECSPQTPSDQPLGFTGIRRRIQKEAKNRPWEGGGRWVSTQRQMGAEEPEASGDSAQGAGEATLLLVGHTLKSSTLMNLGSSQGCGMTGTPRRPQARPVSQPWTRPCLVSGAPPVLTPSSLAIVCHCRWPCLAAIAFSWSTSCPLHSCLLMLGCSKFCQNFRISSALRLPSNCTHRETTQPERTVVLWWLVAWSPRRSRVWLQAHA